MAKKFTIERKNSKLFQLTDKIEYAEDFVAHKLDQHGSDIIVEIELNNIHIEEQVVRVALTGVSVVSTRKFSFTYVPTSRSS